MQPEPRINESLMQMDNWWWVRPLQAQGPLGSSAPCWLALANNGTRQLVPSPATVARPAKCGCFRPSNAAIRQVSFLLSLVRRESGANPLSFFMDLHRFARDPRLKDVAFSATFLARSKLCEEANIASGVGLARQMRRRHPRPSGGCGAAYLG